MLSRIIIVLILFFSCVPQQASAQTDPRATTGSWATPVPWSFVPIHATLLPNGKVLAWGRGHDGDVDATPDIYVWTPSTNSFVKIANPQEINLFCSGHAHLWDGRVLITGGHILTNQGLPTTVIFNSVNNTLSYGPHMNAGRWYPTNLALPNREMFVVGGSTESGGYNSLPQVYSTTTGAYRNLTGAIRSQNYYPRFHIAPNGMPFLTGPGQWTGYYHTTGIGSRKFVANSTVAALRTYGSSVMYAPGKILSVGGVLPNAIANAEVIDLNATTPTWTAVAPMKYRRRHLNATLLPDLTILISGGTTNNNSLADAVLTPELWTPATKAFTNMAPMKVKRVYHSTALLLPDGKVLHLGGNREQGDSVDEFRAEIFSPPYLFKGSRASITSAPSSAGYGQKIVVSTPDNTRVHRVTIVGLGSVTHASNMGQRGNELVFQKKAGSTTQIDVTMPASANLSPPGYYMLFLITSTGVPSTAKVIQIM